MPAASWLQGRRLAFPGDVGRSETLRLAMFPETAEGYVAQASLAPAPALAAAALPAPEQPLEQHCNDTQTNTGTTA